MTVEKLTIEYEQSVAGAFTGRIVALFNPTELSLEQTVGWERRRSAGSAQPDGLDFRSAADATLSVTLFFDTYEPPEDTPSFVRSLSGIHTKTRPTSVLEYTDQVAALAAVEPNLERPPLCRLRWGSSWGKASDGSLFMGVLTSMTRQFLLFLPDGTPVRAKVTCKLTQVSDPEELRSPAVDKKYTVMPHDTLSAIASKRYGDPSKWRVIAQANGIENPRRLSPGRVLLLPKVK